MKRYRLASALCAAALLAGTSAHAVSLPCTWGRTGAAPAPITFSLTYSAFTGGSLPSGSAFTIDCKAPSATATVSLDKGKNTTTFAARQMKLSPSGPDLISYNLTTTTAPTPIWGDTSESTVTKSYDPQGKDRIFADTIFATMNAPADPSVGTYTDTVTARLSATDNLETSAITVQVTVIPECKVVSAFNLNFDVYDPSATSDKTTTGSFSVQCTKGTKVNVGFGDGQNFATVGSRAMKNSLNSDTLKYQIYADNTYGIVWPNDPAKNPSKTAGSKNTAVVFDLYGKVDKRQNVSVGSYNDTVVATVNY